MPALPGFDVKGKVKSACIKGDDPAYTRDYSICKEVISC